MTYIDEDGREWYSKRTKIHSDQTKRRADAKRREREANRLRMLGADPEWTTKRHQEGPDERS